MKHRPHLSYVRSFEASARHLSFTLAAEELNYTQAAVSNHVRSLEEYLGRPLFVRHARSLELTGLGQAYLPGVRQALRQIEEATDAIISRTHDKSVVISCPISLAENWLSRVVATFLSENPEYNVTLHGTIWGDLEDEVSDLSITLKHNETMQAGETRLFHDQLCVVCAPTYEVNGKPITAPEDLTHARLIQILARQDCWKSIAAALELESLEFEGALKSNSSNIGLEMAANGMGCVAMQKSLAVPYIERGLLVEPFEIDVPSPWNYYLTTKANGTKSAVKTFQKYLIDCGAAVTGRPKATPRTKLSSA